MLSNGGTVNDLGNVSLTSTDILFLTLGAHAQRGLL